MWPFTRDRQAFRPGRMGRVRVLRQSQPLLLGPAAAPGVHPPGPARHLRPDRSKSRRARDPAGPPRRRPARPDADRRQKLLRTRLRARAGRAGHPAAAAGPARASRSGQERPCSSRCGRSSSRSTRPSKANGLRTAGVGTSSALASWGTRRKRAVRCWMATLPLPVRQGEPAGAAQVDIGQMCASAPLSVGGVPPPDLGCQGRMAATSSPVVTTRAKPPPCSETALARASSSAVRCQPFGPVRSKVWVASRATSTS